MILLIRSLLQHDWRLRFRSPVSWLALLIGVLLSMLGYFLTSSALGEYVSSLPGWRGLSYFEFVLMGELILLLPLSLLESPLRFTNQMASTKVIEEFIWNGSKTLYKLAVASLALIYKDFLSYFIYLFVLTHFLAQKYSISEFLQYVFLLILCAPLFLSLGLILSSIYLIFRRGGLALGQLSYILSLVSGVFFPITIWSNTSFEYIKWLTPTVYFVEVGRLVFEHKQINWLHTIAFFLIWFLIASVLASLLWKKALKSFKQRPPAAAFF